MFRNENQKIEISIEKCVAEYNILEQNYTPYAKFKVKVFECGNSGKFRGFTNLQIRTETGDYFGSVGYGDTVEKALEDTLKYFFEMLSRKEPTDWIEEDFLCSDSYDF